MRGEGGDFASSVVQQCGRARQGDHPQRVIRLFADDPVIGHKCFFIFFKNFQITNELKCNYIHYETKTTISFPDFFGVNDGQRVLLK